VIATIAISVCAILAFKVREVAPARGRGARVRECALPPLFPRAHTRAHARTRAHIKCHASMPGALCAYVHEPGCMMRM